VASPTQRQPISTTDVDWINENMKTVKAVIRRDEHGRRFFDLVGKVMPTGTPLSGNHVDAIHRDLAWLEMQKQAIASRHGLTLATLDKIDKVRRKNAQ